MLSNISTHYLQKCIVFLAILTLLQVSITQAFAQGPNLADYGYYRTITIDHNSVVGTGIHTNFPYFINVKDVSFGSTNQGGRITNSNGYDVLFTNHDGSQVLEFEIDRYDRVNGDYFVWIKIPELSCTNNTVIRMYYGNNTANTNASTAGVYPANYLSVWHLETSSALDALGNNHPNRVRSSGITNGKLGMAIEFDGRNDYINFDAIDVPGTEATFSAWFKPLSVTDEPKILAKSTGNYLIDQNWTLDLEHTSGNNAMLRFRMKTTSGTVEVKGGTVTVGQYYSANATYNGNTVRLYLNGIEVANAAHTGSIAASPSVEAWLGGTPTGRRDNPFDGIIDETRIIAATLSADEILTEYTNISDPTSNYILSPELLNVPVTIAVSGTATNPTCIGYDGTIDLSVVGGIAPITFAWSNGETTEDLIGLNNGTYTVTVTDGSNNTVSKSFALTAPVVLSVQSTLTQNTCVGDPNASINLSVTGGAAPYQYMWSNGMNTMNLAHRDTGTYTVVVVDANNCTATATETVTTPTVLTQTLTATNATCNNTASGNINIAINTGLAPYSFNWSNGSNQQNQTNLAAGTYYVTIEDAGGCSAIDSATITEPSSLLLAANLTHLNCANAADGAIALNVNGGTTPYTFTWADGNSQQNRNGLAAGTYAVTVTDAGSCSVAESVTLQEPRPMTATATVTTVACNGDRTGAIDITVAGGQPPYIYYWSTNSWSTGYIQEDQDDLPAGTYTVTITDANGCTATHTETITEPSALSVSSTVTDILCNGNNDGTISIQCIGGTTPFTYAWSNGATTANLQQLAAGTYDVTVTDANNCTTTHSEIITAGTSISITQNTSHVSCNGQSDGSIGIVPTGGKLPYAYSWSNGANTRDLNQISGGSYQVTVTDATGCSATISSVVNEPALMSVVVKPSNVSCNALNDGLISLNVVGGALPISYNWSDGSNSKNRTNIGPGNYSVTVTDANGCSLIKTASIAQPAPIMATANKVDIDCNGNKNGSITLQVSGGDAPYTYSWLNGNTTANLTNIGAGSYAVTITDAKGCSTTITETISQPAPFSLSLSATHETATRANDGTVTANVQGGSYPLTYSWSNGATSSAQQNLGGGNYSLTVTDANGCQHIQSVTINAYYNSINAGVPTTGNQPPIGSSYNLTWVGGNNSNWNEPENWNPNRLPTCSDNVLITKDMVHMPIITNGVVAYAKDLTVTTGGKLSMETGSEMNICGNLTTDGLFSSTGGWVKFIGQFTQYVSGNSKAKVYNLQISNTADTSIVLNQSLVVRDQLNLDDGVVYTGGDTLILSNPMGNGQVITAYSNKSYVVGNLRRNINPNTDTYIFPVGTGFQTGFHWAKISNNNLQGVNDITVSFRPLTRHNDNDINFADNDITYASASKEGMWVINPNNQPTGGKYDVTLSTDNLRGLIDNDFGILKRANGTDATQWSDDGGTKSAYGGAGRLVADGYARLRNLNSFSEFCVSSGNSNGPMLKLGSFDALYNLNTGNVDLNWTKKVETNAAYYVIQRSLDGIEFKDVATVDAIGISTEEKSYAGFDNNPPIGIVYYRLKQYDSDGGYSYTQMVSVSITKYTSYKTVLFPNPTKDYVNLTVSTEGKKITVMLINLSGHLMQMYELESLGGEFTTRLALQDGLPGGQYLVKISTEESESIQKLMILQ